jgi:endonuclease YncB( thermonuclease family)
MGSTHSLLQQAIIADTETLGLMREISAIHEISILNLGTRELDQFILRPHLTVAENLRQSDVLGLTSSYSDKFAASPELAERAAQLGKRGKPLGWQDAITARVLMMRGKVERLSQDISPSELMKMLKSDDTWLYKMIKEEAYPWFPDAEGKVKTLAQQDAYMQAQVKKLGVDAKNFKTHRLAMSEALQPDSALMRKLKGHTIWVANAQFESKQFGAQISLLERAARDAHAAGLIDEEQLHRQLRQATGLRDILPATSMRGSEMLYVTGVEVQRAKALAARTGDWRGVYEAYLKHTRPGTGEVRDIIDVIKAQQSYMQELGVMKKGGPLYSLGIESSWRLEHATQAATGGRWDLVSKSLSMSEPHVAALDNILSERVLTGTLDRTEALRQVSIGSAAGKEFLEQAKSGRGLLYEAMIYGKLKEELAPAIQSGNLVKRVTRMYEDFAKEITLAGQEGRTPKPATWQFSHYKAGAIEQVTREGARIKAPINIPVTNPFFSGEAALEYMRSTGQYGAADFDKETARLHRYLEKSGAIRMRGNEAEIINAERLRQASVRYAERRPETLFRQEAKQLQSSGRWQNLLSREAMGRPPGGAARLAAARRGLADLPIPRGMGARVGLAAAALGIVGFAGGQRGGDRDRPASLHTMDYKRWLEAQPFSGMQEGGVAGRKRGYFSDFGSPYQGPIATQAVFQQQELLAEREKYLRFMYVAQHLDPETSVIKGLRSLRVDSGGDAHSFSSSIRSLFSTKAAVSTVHQYIDGPVETVLDTQAYAGLRGRNLLRIDLSSGRWRAEAEDADTIVVKRAGVAGALNGFFGFDKGVGAVKFRLAGIDAPETEHAGGSGFHRAQPYANAGKIALQQILSGSSNLELIFDPNNITYGRAVGMVYDDGRNINVDLLKRGLASYLPFKKKGVLEMYDQQMFSRANKLSQGADRGMWGTPFFQAYRDITTASGQTITFNTFTQIDKIAKNATMMSATSLMQNAEAQGFYGNAAATEAAFIGKRFNDAGYRPDYQDPILMRRKNAPHNSYLSEMLEDTAKMSSTRGSSVTNRLRRRGNYGSLDKALVLDTLGSTNSVWTHRSSNANRIYGTRSTAQDRRQQMAMAQRRVNHQMFQSPIGHHRM